MKPRVKSTLILLATLIIGMVLGGLVAGAMMRAHFAMIPSPDDFAPRFERAFMRAIDPEPEQEDAVREILNRHSARMAGMFQEHMQAAKNQTDSLKAELSTVLTEEQITRLDNKLKRISRMMRGGKPGWDRGKGRGRRGEGHRDGPPGDRPPQDSNDVI